MNSSSYLHYKTYSGSIDFSAVDQVFHGKVLGITSLISYEGENLVALTQDFQNAIDEYLDHCAESGRAPEQPFGKQAVS